jgi:TRAP-type C4-dicarboxylate transport system permease small subunit
MGMQKQNLMNIVYALLSLSFFIFGAYLTWNVINLYLNGTETVGTYESSSYTVRSCGSDIYSFTDAKGLQHQASTVCDALTPSEQIKIVYNPSNPDENTIPTPNSWMQGPILLAFSVLFFFAFFARIQNQKKKAG